MNSVSCFRKGMGFGISKGGSTLIPNPTYPEAYPQLGYGVPSGNILDVKYFGTFSQSSNTKYSSINLAPNGFLYSFPLGALYTPMKIDPVKRTNSFFGSTTTAMFSQGAVTAQDGNIYAIPASGTAIQWIDTATDTVATFGSVAAGAAKYRNGCLAQNGMIYCTPSSAQNCLVIDPIAKTVSTFGSFGAGTLKWSSMTLARNGKLYCTPYNSNSVLVINPMDNSTYTFGLPHNFTMNGSAVANWLSGTLHPDGKIYCAPYSAKATLVIDPETDTLSSFLYQPDTTFSGISITSATAAATVFGSCATTMLGTNQKLYAFSAFASNSTTDRLKDPMEIDPQQRTHTRFVGTSPNTFGMSVGTTPFQCGCLAPNGNLLGVPTAASSICEISGFEPARPEMYTMPTNLMDLPGSAYNRHMNK